MKPESLLTHFVSSTAAGKVSRKMEFKRGFGLKLGTIIRIKSYFSSI